MRLHNAALHYAALLNKIDIARLLLDAGADPNSKDKFRRSPLYYAGGSMSNVVFEMLLDSGADRELMRDN